MADCGEALRDDLAERYVLGRLAGPERESFERHFFACERCFAQVMLCEALRHELRAGARRVPGRWLRWALPAAAAAMLAVAGVGLWNGPAARPPATADRRSPAAAPVVLVPASPTATAPGTALLALAAIAPARYAPVVVRGAETGARQEFRAAMERYAAGDFAAAAAGLERARAQNPGAADVAFYLGVARLLEGHEDAGLAALEETIASGDTPWLEEALLDRGKARVRRGEYAAARRDLARVAEMAGDFAAEATRIIAALPPPA